MQLPKYFLFICMLFTYVCHSHASVFVKSDSLCTITKLHLDLPLLEKDHKLIQEIKYISTQKKEFSVNLYCYLYNINGDSTLVYSLLNRNYLFNEGTSILKVPFSNVNDRNNYLNDNFYKSFDGLTTIPFGQYKIFISLQSKDSQRYANEFAYSIDSTLVPYSSLKRTIDKIINSNLTASVNNSVGIVNAERIVKPSKILARLSKKLEHELIKKGFELKQNTNALQNYLSVYYKGIFVGRYSISENNSLHEQVNELKNNISQNINSFSNLAFLNTNSLLAQMKSMLTISKDPVELIGTLSLANNFASAQPEYSNVNNNYYELRGDISTKVFSIPLSIEAYYNSQDINRKLKSSFLRVHYDVSKYRSTMQTAINGFKTQFDQLEAKGKGMEMIYDNCINQLQRQKSNLMAVVLKQTGFLVSNFTTISEDALKNEIQDYLKKKLMDTLISIKQAAIQKKDSTITHCSYLAKTKSIADSVDFLYQHIMKLYNEYKALEVRILKYTKLIDQYKNAHYFDSSLGYSQIQNLLQESNPRKWFNASQHFLPNNKGMQLLSRLVNFDIGIINSYASKFTLGGQQLKGLDMAYDIGLCKLGISVGHTSFVGRDGSLDKYFTYTFKSGFTFSKNQQAQVVYYSYIPSLQQELNLPFYKNLDFTLPSFKNPVHILASNYEGVIFGLITLRGELASSRFSGQDWVANFQSSKLAWNLSLEGQIPHTPLQFKSLVEHGGIDFNNATLPINISGTDRYQCALRGTFFKSFLTASIDFNRLQQQNFSYSGGNNRWGFEIATHSKQYPSISISYKPYATFRSYTDTFLIPQRPILGAVSIGKISYQLKRSGSSIWRFMAMYNRSVSIVDSLTYDAQMSQGLLAYATKNWQTSFSFGVLRNANNSIVTPAHQQSSFYSFLICKQINSKLSLSGGADIAYSNFGLSKYAMSSSVNYMCRRLPFSLRLAIRNMTYKNLAEDPWKKIYAGSIEIIWKLKMKLS